MIFKNCPQIFPLHSLSPNTHNNNNKILPSYIIGALRIICIGIIAFMRVAETTKRLSIETDERRSQDRTSGDILLGEQKVNDDSYN